MYLSDDKQPKPGEVMKKAIAWESWLDLTTGTMFLWHPEDESPAGDCMFVSEAVALDIRANLNRCATDNDGSVVYVVVGIIQKTHPPVIGVYRDRAMALRRSADGKVYPVSDPRDDILKGSDSGWCAFDDRDYVYPQLHAIVRRGG